MRTALPSVGLVALLLSGCWLEKVTGEPVPLDPRFYAAVEEQQGAPGVGGGASIPFAGYDGELVLVTGTVDSPQAGPVEIDIRTPDPTAEGGVKGHGKVQLEGPGEYELSVPINLGVLELQAFQDPDTDGPGGDDPFAQVRLEVGSEPIPGTDFTLVPGARGSMGGPEHHEAPPGAPGGDPSGGPAHEDAPPGGDGEPGPMGPDGQPPPDGPPPEGQPPEGGPPSPGGMPPFVGLEGDTVQVAGTLLWPGAPAGTVIDLDLFKPSDTAGGGREMLGKLKLPPGEFSFTAPASFGPLILEAFVDLDGDGPGTGDPMGRYEDNPVVVGSRDVSDITITLALTDDGRMPGNAPPPPQDRPPGL